MFPSLKNISKLAAAALAMMTLTPYADARLEKTLPKDTYGVVQLADIASLQARLATHPAKKTWLKLADPNGYFGPGLKKLNDELAKSEDFFAQDLDQLLNFIKTNVSGEILLAVTKKEAQKGGREVPFGVIVAADFAASEKDLAALIAKLSKGDKKANGTTSTYQGVTLHEYETNHASKERRKPIFGWTVANKTLIFAPPQELRDTVDAVLNGRKDSFADTAIWKRSISAAGKNDIFLLVNTPLLTSELRAFVVKENPKDPDDVPNPLEPDPIHAYDTLALDAVDEIWSATKLTADGVSGKASLAYKEKRGLLTLLTLKPLGTLVPNYISANQIGFGTIGIDLNQAWKNAEALFQAAIPAIKPTFDLEVSELKKKQGIDLRGALFENFGENISFVYGINTQSVKTKPKTRRPNLFSHGYEGLYVIGFRDTAKLEALIQTTLGKVGGKDAEKSFFQTNDFMGVKIHKFTKTDEVAISYALYDGKVFLAIGEGILENAIAEAKKPQNPLTKSPHFQQLLRRVPKDAVSFEYSDAGILIANYLEIIEAFIISTGGGAKELAKVIDITKRPKAKDIPWVGYSYTTERNNEIVSEGYLIPRK